VCRQLLTEAFRYAFGAVGVLVAIIRASNERSLRLARHLGFKDTYRVADGWQAGEDMLVLEMRRAQCRWLTKETIHE
jgi:RimJ/RimL family protein N-acetyltransferase